MNIKVLDSWLRDYLQTDATPKQIAEKLSLTSVSIERIEKWKNDHLYDIEVTTNRPDLASIVGLAREAGAVLPQSGIDAKFEPPKYSSSEVRNSRAARIVDAILDIQFDPKLVNRICAVIMEVTIKPSPEKIQNRLESTDIRSLNNVIDVTNYVMRTIGHPTHVFDLDRLDTDTLIIREAKKGEKVTTLDGKTYTLSAGDMVATDKKGRIVDLLAIMGLENSVVTEQTKRILFFVNNQNATRVRKTSMRLGIRTEAAQLNEKGIDPEIAMDALLYGIQLYQEIADGKIIAPIIDLYPNKVELPKVEVPLEKVNSVIGVSVPDNTSVKILNDLGFKTTLRGKTLQVTVPSFRALDVTIPEDVIEEIARVYGYYKIPSIIPPLQPAEVTAFTNDFYWEDRIRKALKYWGFTEVMTYPMVSEVMYEGETDDAVKLSNPLGEEFVYMRRSLIPSLLKVKSENKRFERFKIFEIANVYEKQPKKLPLQKLHLAGLLKEKGLTFFIAKGILEQLFSDLGISTITYKQTTNAGIAAEIYLGKTVIGSLEVLDSDLIDFEIDLSLVLPHTTTSKTIKPVAKFPPIIEDLAFIISPDIPTEDIIAVIKRTSSLLSEVSLLDRYQSNRTFHIHYQSPGKNLTNEEVGEIREKIVAALKEKYTARLK